MLFLLFAACREGMFGRNCQQPCGSDLNCKGLLFCLPDPYGCSCASGWMGTRCETRKCENNGILSSRFLSAWHVTALVFSSFCQPALRTCMDQTADWAVNARMVEFASVSVDAHVPQGGEDKAVRNQVGFTFNPLIHYFQQHLYIIELWCMRRKTSWACKLGQNLHFFFFQTGPHRSWNWKEIWSGISIPPRRSSVQPQEIHFLATTALSWESWTALCSR